MSLQIPLRSFTSTPTSQSTSGPNSSSRPLILPRLPVPDLRKTLEKYVKSLEPFLLEDAQHTGTSYHEAHALRVKWMEEFFSGVGKTCQDRLIALDRQSPNNWLDDNFWLKTTYLTWRAPLLINSNWWLAFQDDEFHPSSFVSTHTDRQLKRAAWLVHHTVDCKNKVDMQELYPDTTRAGVWFRENVLKLFNMARIPKKDCDIHSPQASHSETSAKDIIVLVNNWFYSLRVYEPGSTIEVPLPSHPNLILTRLHGIIEDAHRRPGLAPRIGVLSADSRDRWASNLEHLLSLSPQNRQTYASIVSSLFCLSLDAETYMVSSPSATTLPPPTGLTQQELDSHLLSIRSVPCNVSNRFFDKPYTLIVDSSGRAGAMGEHSFCDALVPSMVAEYALVQSVDPKLSSLPPESLQNDSGWARLDWDVDDSITAACDEAYLNAVRLMEDSDDSVLWFEDYGQDWIRNDAKSSPDAYIQMALQLAWYRTRGTFTATYETALTRMFNKGRTETIRTLSTDSRAFVLSVDDPSATVHTKRALLQRAIQTHTSLTREAMTGRGIDRHLLGLRNMLRGNESAAIFDDPMFSRSQEWRLSTSGLSAGLQFRGTGFGTLYPDGYGINYLAAPNLVKFGIESKHSNKNTSTEQFKIAVVAAMKDLKSISMVSSSKL